MRLHIFISSLPPHLKLLAKGKVTTDEKSKQTPSLHAVKPQSHFFSGDDRCVSIVCYSEFCLLEN